MPSRRIAPLAGLALGWLLDPAFAEETTVELDTISVTTDAYESATGPVKGYRATRSASATKTDTALRDIPQSISVIPATVLKDLGSTNVERALEFAGGVSKQNNFGGLTLYEYSVRGFTTSEFYQDGFSANRGYPSTPDAATIERIEVLKGPAASLYGRGDPGGTVNIVTKKPQPEAFTTLQTSAGSWDRYRTALDINTPLDNEGHVLSRVNLAVEDNHSFRDHVQSKSVFVAPSFSWQLDPDTSLLVESEFVRHSSTFDRGIVDAPGLSRETFLGEPNDGDIDNHNNRIQATLEHHLNDAWKLRLASHYKQGSLWGDASENRALNADGHTLNRRYRERSMGWHDSITQLELRGLFDVGSWQHELLIGTEYEDYRKKERVTAIAGSPGSSYAIDIYNPVYGQTKPNGIRSGTDFFEHTKSHALNLQDQIVFTDRLRGMVGARFEHFQQTVDDFTRNVPPSRQTHHALTQRAGLLYQLTPEVGVFANASTSFKPNSGLDATGNTFKPEEGVGYEVGIKSELFDDRLSATLAAFHIEKENVLALDPATNTNRAMGKARSQGFDLQLTGQLTDAVRVIGAFAYIDAEVTKGDKAIPAGNRILGVAKRSGSLLGVYEFQDGALRGSDVGAAFTYVGDRSGEAGSSFELPAYHTVDLLAHYKATENVTVGLNMNNLFDEKYYERSYSNYWISPGEPRNLTVSLSLSL